MFSSRLLKFSRRARYPIGAVAALAVSACASSDARKKPSVVDSYSQVVRDRAAAAADGPHRVRHNPTPCACPPFEVQLQGAWHRVVFLVADDQLADLATTQERLEREQGSEALIAGSFDDTLTVCANGALVVSLQPTDLDAQTPPTDDE